MVRYAYVNYASNDWSSRWLITAPDGETLDKWWRKTSDKNPDYKRLGPDFYIYTTTNPNETVPDMCDSIMTTLLPDRGGRDFPVIMQPERADNVSGKTFYIRSKHNPKLYWTEYDQGYIFASERSPTRFRIRIDGDDDNKGKVMIGEDNIIITSVKDTTRTLGVNDYGQLQLGVHSCHMRFSDLKHNFLADTAEAAGDAPVTKVGGFGEEWELVG